MSIVKAIAFYLPQFHPTAFNDNNWGPGFSDWTNVVQGRARFPGHYQPRLPGELGFYDLRYKGIYQEQITLAQAHGIYGFCFYHYQFGKERELDIPVRNLLSRPFPVLPFCLCWANENWTRAWDGRSGTVIKAQTYNEETVSALVDYLVWAMRDPRYIRLAEQPLFLIYQLEHIPEPRREWLNSFRDRIASRIGIAPMMGAVYSHGLTEEMASLVEFVVQFPPHRIPRKRKRSLLGAEVVKPFAPDNGDFFEAYSDVAQASIEGVAMVKNLVPGVCPDWDNSARRGKNAHMLIGSTPDKFSSWVSAAAGLSMKKAAEKTIPYPLLFVNAWNEWAEGASLEPTWAHKREYLEAFKRGLL